MNDIQKAVELLVDPINGPFYGEDFCIDDQGYIQANSIKVAAVIMRQVNQSGNFETKLVKINSVGDVVLLGFDTLINNEPVFETTVGPGKTAVCVRKTDEGKYCLYSDGKRSSRMFNKLTNVKKYIKNLDQELHQVAAIEETDEE